jgi:hypothetical protein
VSAADPTMGLVQALKADETVNELTSGRIIRPKLLEEEVPEMPRACVIVRAAGGGAMFGRGNLQVLDSRLDCVCYGSEQLEADNIGREVTRALKNLQAGLWGEGELGGPVKLYWARIAGAVSASIEPDVEWPFALISTQVMHSLNTL